MKYLQFDILFNFQYQVQGKGHSNVSSAIFYEPLKETPVKTSDGDEYKSHTNLELSSSNVELPQPVVEETTEEKTKLVIESLPERHPEVGDG